MAVLFIIGTGDGSKIVKAENAVVGDLNSDNDVGTDDMNILCKYLVGDASSTGTDVNGDTAVDVRDLIRYKRYLTEASKTLTGEGTEAVPYLISSLADMYKFLEESQNSESAGKYYKVTADIVVNVGDATSLNPTEALVRQWDTIGTSETSFAGTLNGNGNTISGIYLSDATDLTNLLGWVDVDAGTVTGLNVDSSNINPTFSATTSVKYEGATVTNSEIPTCEASITTGTDTVFYQAFTNAMDVANTVNEIQPESATVDVVVLNDVTLSAQVQVKRSITIKNAQGKVVTIKRGTDFTDGNMFAINGGNVTSYKATFTLEAQRKSDVGQLIIDGNKAVSTNYPIINNSQANTTFVMGEYVTIQNAAGSAAGSALQNSGTAELYGNVKNNTTSGNAAAIRNNKTLIIYGGNYSGNTCTRADKGGVIFNNAGTVTIAGGMFSNNEARVGAVISNHTAGTVTITGGTFSGNTATANYGGAIYNDATSTMSISGATFSGNNALYGGAIYNLSSANMTIANTTFTGNGAALINDTRITGGAIYHGGAAMSLSNCTFTSNGGDKIASAGGAVYCASAGSINITGGSFTDNKAMAGGAICASAGNVALNAVEITKNYARDSVSGGGALHLMGTATASIKDGASITNNINGKLSANIARTVDISFANNGTCTLYLLDDTFKSGYLGCYLSDSTATGNSSNKYVVREGTEYAISYNAYCKVNYADNTSEEATNVPDYSDSVNELNIYAHRSTSNGTFIDLNGTQLDYGDYRTKERFQEYKDCGFNVLYVQENNYNGEAFETSETKKCLDLAYEVGLQCIFIDERIRQLSRSTVSLIGEGAQFASLEALTNQLSTYMAPYIDHPAFYGLATVDEPQYLQLQATGEVYKALKLVDEDIYVKTTLSPFKKSNGALYYTGVEGSSTATLADYQKYIEKYLQESGTACLSYDDYPFRTDSFLTTYFSNLQYMVTAAAAKGADVELVVQSFAHANTRLPDLNELYLQNNAALAFGVKNLGYFTYWRAGGDTMTGGILDYDGTKMIYDEVQEVIAYTRKMANVMLNFDYEKAYVTYDSANSTEPDFFADVESQELDNLTVESVTQPTIVTQMKDETNNRTGYMVVNVQSSVNGFSEPEVVVLNFEGYKYATYYIGDTSKTVSLQDGKFKFVLAEGDGVFVIPHN